MQNYRSGQLQRAAEYCQQALKIQGKNLDALAIGSEIASALGNNQQAKSLLKRALATDPGNPQLHNNLGNVLKKLGDIEAGIAHLDMAIDLDPNYAEAWLNRANGLAMQGHNKEAVANYRQALQLQPELQLAHTNMLFIMSRSDDYTAEDIFKEHKSFAAGYEKRITREIPHSDRHRDQGKKLRIGYLSADFYSHSVAYFIAPVLEHHDHDSFEIHAYYSNTIHDDVTDRLAEYCDCWRDVNGIALPGLARIISDDRIDILVDLSGYTAASSTLVCAYKPAPVQIEWIGYPNTTGLESMDYWLTDAHADPIGMSEKLYTETLLRMPECFSVYEPPAYAPDITPPPAAKNGFITFGSFNNYSKTNETTIKTWAEILNRVPNSKLTLKSTATGDSGIQSSIRSAFAKHGITPDRLTLLKYETHKHSHLARYGEMDISLDTFPYNGTTTSYEALWMGVPVVTVAGNDHRSRVGVSILENLNHPEWIANNRENYVDIACSLADIDKLGNIRARLREEMGACTLTNARHFTIELEHIYRKVWNDWKGSNTYSGG